MAGELDVPCNPQPPLEGATTGGGAPSGLSNPHFNCDILSLGVAGGCRILPEGRIRIFAMETGSGPEGSSLTVDYRRSSGSRGWEGMWCLTSHQDDNASGLALTFLTS